MRCTYKTPLGFRASTTISPIRLRLLGEMVAHLAQGFAPRPQRSAEMARSKQAEHNRRALITLLLEEKQIIQRKAYIVGLSVSEYLR